MHIPGWSCSSTIPAPNPYVLGDVQLCFFGKQSCTSTNTNGSGAGIADENDQPWMWILIDQVESPQGGLIPVLKERQTSRKCHVATIFVDHFSKLTYVNFSGNITANEAVEAKHAFEQYAEIFGVKIHYSRFQRNHNFLKSNHCF